MVLDITGRYRYPAPRNTWLQQYTEDIIEPTLPIIDPHHHIWEEQGNTYLLPELTADLHTGHNIVATVFVQAGYGYRQSGEDILKCVGETEKIVQLAAAAHEQGMATDVCTGIVGFADLTLGARVSDVLEAHLQAAPGRFKSIRHSVSRDPNFPDGIVLRPAPAGLLADTQYRAGLAKVAEYDLGYDAMLYHRQIPELTALARALPHLPIVLNHFGCIIGVGPYLGREKENFESWRRDLRELAQCNNVVIKLGGMGMIICGACYHERPSPPASADLAADWRPYVETCIELFGVERCMFESNFPVDKAMFSYPVLWNAYKRLTAGASVGEKAALFHDTAARFYRIQSL